jgi:hypothetical protein
MDNHQKIIDRIFKAQDENGFWKIIPESHKYYPDYMHYIPNFRATLWTLILLADLGHDRKDARVRKPLSAIQDHFFDPKYGIYTLKKDHFPIPCLNGNMIYLDSYFNGAPGDQSMKALEFFCKYQRFDDGAYITPKNEFCSNTSCYGKHTCYWGIIKLFKGISFVPLASRNGEVSELLDRCIQFILLHKVCFSSHRGDRIMIQHIDKLTFPNMYRSDFLEILWLLKREKVKSREIRPALDLLKEKKQQDGHWNLERKVHNMITTIGEVDQPNPYVTNRANEVMNYFVDV